MSVYNVHARNPKARRRARHVRAWLNGVEITNRCFYADVRRGVARCYRVNAEGKKYVEHAEFRHWNVPPHLRPQVAKEELRGRVVVKRLALA